MIATPDVSDDGVDRSLIRWMLSLTPRERLRVMQDHVDALKRLGRGAPRQAPARRR